MSYSTDLREKVIQFIENGGDITDAAHTFGITKRTIYNWIKKKKETGSLEDKPPKRGWKKLEPQNLIAFVKEHPDFTLAEYAAHFGVAPPSVCVAFRRLKITRKKRQRDTKSEMKRGVQYFWSRSPYSPKVLSFT